MAGNAAFELASASASELGFSGSYLNGQRGGNYREGSESRMLGLGFGVPRGGSTSVVALDQIHTLSQSISLDPIVIGREIAWYDELRRVLGISAGSTAEENSFRADVKDLKCFRLSVEDTCLKARFRATKMDERLRKLDKYCEYLTSKKQKRNELTSIDRAGALNLKTGSQIYSINQREDRPKNILLNKRVRTSVAESRAKDGNLLEDNVGESDLFEKIRRLAAGGEGWDKKVKRKRSTGMVSSKPADNGGVPKRAVQNKVVVENGSQPPDAHIYRLNNHDDSLSNRKHHMTLGSSSPPMAAQWGGQRLQKMARARRPFLVSIVSNQDEKLLSFGSCSPTDVGARLTTSKQANGSPISKIETNNPKKLMVKLDNVQSSPRLCETQSVGRQSRLPDKEMEESEMNAVENMNKHRIDLATPKPFQTRKTSYKKNGSKPGRRLKKLSDRKGFLQHSPLQNVSSPDCAGASDDDREELLAAANHARTATYLACSSPFWKKMEPVFASVSFEDKSFLSQQMDFISDQPTQNGSLSGKSDADKTPKDSIPLYQRVLSALIIEDDIDTPEEVDATNMPFMNPLCVSTYDTYNLNGSYENTSLVDRLLVELKSIGLCQDMLPVLEDEESETIQDEIDGLNTRLHQQEVTKKVYVEKISNNIDSSSRARELETLAMDRLIEQAYRKLLARRSSRSGIQKMPKPAALAFANRTLARCQKYENSGISCFNVPPFQDILFAPVASSDEAFPINGPSSNRGKKREVFLDDISTTKMKKTKQKTKPRQQSGQTPTPKNTSDNKHTGTTHPTGPKWLSSSSNMTDHPVNDLDPLDEIGVGPDLGVPHDLTSFLNFDEQDPEVDFTAGLDIPMDDLTELF